MKHILAATAALALALAATSASAITCIRDPVTHLCVSHPLAVAALKLR